MSILCSQCGGAAERCEHCGAGVCSRRFCVELHEAACAALSTLPTGPTPSSNTYSPRPRSPRRERNLDAERGLAEQLMLTIGRHRQAGRAALLAGDLDTAFDQLWAARQLEPDLDRLGADARAHLPADWELETDLLPLARALSARQHERAVDAWRHVLDDRPARSIQAEAAEWLAGAAQRRGNPRGALRALHAASHGGRGTPPETFQALYHEAGLDPHAAFALYLAATHLDAGSARAVVLRDPLTDAVWPDQDARWWPRYEAGMPGIRPTDHQAEALERARDLAVSARDQGWVMLAEGDLAAGPLGARELGRSVRAGRTEAADEDAFVRIRLAYETAAERLPDVAWPAYRLAELLAWAGFGERAKAYLADAERRGLGDRAVDRAARGTLRDLVLAGLGEIQALAVTAARPYPTEPFAPVSRWRWPFR